jgi:hypothetical protein
MPLQDDQSISGNAVLFRVLQDPNWTTYKGGRRRPSSLAFYEAHGEVSYFVDTPGMLSELHRIFPGREIARVPASVVRQQGFAIERRPNECPDDFQCDRTCHVVAGPTSEIQRLEFQRRARTIATHQDVTIIPAEPMEPDKPPPSQ